MLDFFMFLWLRIDLLQITFAQIFFCGSFHSAASHPLCTTPLLYRHCCLASWGLIHLMTPLFAPFAPIQPGRRTFLSILSILRHLLLLLDSLSLWPKISSCMSAFDTQLVKPQSLVKAPSSSLYDLYKVSSIWMLFFFHYSRI